MMDRVFAPMVSVNAGDGSESSGYGNDSPSEISQVMVIDASAERALTRSVKRPASGTAKDECLLPRSAVYDDGALYVTCLGIDSLLQLDARSQDPSHSERKRWHVAAGPTGVAIDRVHHQAIVWSQFEREVAFVPLDADAPPAALALARQSGGTPANVAMGRRLFHKMGDERISSDGRACASCHPDGREDAITWSTPDGPRQTPMLAGRVEDTAPYGWMGSSEKVPQHLAKTFERLGGTGLPNDEVTALIDYLKTMAPPRARAVPPEAERAKLLARGREIFESSEAACSSCHQKGRGYADGERHDVRSSPSAPGTKEAAFDTPSLRFIAGTAPYFHDGRYKTLDDVLVAPDHEMGNARLTRADRAALVAFLETL
jgi:cytochrome c peroxidase